MNEPVRGEADRELLANDLLPPLVPPGLYVVHTARAEVRIFFKRRPSC